MFLGDFHPFGDSCPTLSISQNALCSFVCEFIKNDAQINKSESQMACINKALLKKIGDGSFDAVKSCQAFENLLTSNKKYIVESLNKIQHFKNTHGELTTRKLNKNLRRHITCLLVNNFLETYTPEIKQLTDEGEPEEEEDDEEDDGDDLCEYCDHDENECECRCNNCDQKGDDCVCNLDLVDEVIGLREELKQAYKNKEPICFHCDKKKGDCNCFLFLNKNVEKEIIIEKDEIKFSWCGRCHNTLKTCICYSDLVVNLDAKIEKIEANETQLLKIINVIKEDKANQWIELEGAKEIIKGHQPIEKECNEEINKLKEQIKELELKSQSDYQTYKNMGRHIDILNEDIRVLKQEKTNNKKENTRLKNKLEETERFRQENSKAVKETVEETYKLNAVIEKLKKDNDFSLKNQDHFNNDNLCCLGCVCNAKIEFFTKLMKEYDEKKNDDIDL